MGITDQRYDLLWDRSRTPAGRGGRPHHETIIAGIVCPVVVWQNRDGTNQAATAAGTDGDIAAISLEDKGGFRLYLIDS